MLQTLQRLSSVLLLVGCTTSVAISRPAPDDGPVDVGVDRGLPDLGVDVGVDQGPLACTHHRVSACTASHAEISCDPFLDGSETAPVCPRGSLELITCRAADNVRPTPSYCDPCPGVDDCLQPFWIRFDLGTPRPVNELRFIAGWWRDRPRRFEVWYADAPLADPEVGGTLVMAQDAAEPPWACVTGERCTEEVPDGCCPDGRDQPQVTDQRSYAQGCDLGDNFPKFDIARFPAATARYWWLYVRSTNFDDRVFLHEVELRHCR